MYDYEYEYDSFSHWLTVTHSVSEYDSRLITLFAANNEQTRSHNPYSIAYIVVW